MDVQLQWGLEQSTNAAIKGARDLIHAASTDNIQVKAIIACEGFGATIAMCQETCRKIERTVIPAPPPVLISFIACAIGYSAGDCVSRLGGSLAGVQFLGLAATLVTTLPIHEAGNLLASMLASSAVDQTLVPSRRQTIDLLKSIEGRCYRAAFGEEVFGWELLLGERIQQNLAHIPGPAGASTPSLRSRPGTDGIEVLVDALRKLNRVGESDISGVSIRTAQAVPWTIAFVKWCLGIPPSVVLEDGERILSQDGSRVQLVVSQGDPSVFEVTLYRSTASLSTLIKTEVDHRMVGMIGVASYGKLLLHDKKLDGNFPMRVICQVIPFGVQMIMRNLAVLKDTMNFGNQSKRPDTNEFHISDVDLHNQRLSPFPDEAAILETCSHLLGCKFSTQIQPLPDGRTMFELPLVKQYIDEIGGECLCAKCSDNTSSNKQCSKERFVTGVVQILATIFILSLFDHQDSLRVTTSTSAAMAISNSFGEAISSILIHNSPFSCEVSDILRWALWLVRHDEIEVKQWVMSCNKDQALLPMLYETSSFLKQGYLRLLWLPGKLRFQNDTYELVVSKSYNFVRRNRKNNFTMPEPVSGPCNLFPGARSRWQIASQDDILEASMLIDGPSHKYSAPWMFSSPHQIISNLAEALLVDDCCHGRAAELTSPDFFCQFLNPFQSGSVNLNSEEAEHSDGERSDTGSVWIIPVDGSEKLRLAALGRIRRDIPIVLRGNSCLACCLKVCRRAGCQLLIL